MAKYSDLVDVDHKSWRKYGGAFPIGQVQRLRGSPDQICMGTRSGWCVFAEDVENLRERSFERGMGGLHGMLQGHSRSVPIEVIVVEAAGVEQAAGVVEVTGGTFNVIFHVDPRASVMTARSPSFRRAARSHPSSSRGRTDRPAGRTWKPKPR